MRAIDADALYEYICGSINEMTKIGVMVDGEYLWGLINEGIENAPTIEPMEWIPCSERLPEDSGDYLVRPSDSVLEDYSDFNEVMIMPYDADCEAFGWWVERYHPISLGYLDSDFNEVEVLAWMPLPPVYEGAEEQKMQTVVSNSDSENAKYSSQDCPWK